MPQEVDGSGEIEDGSNLPSANSKLPSSIPPTIQKLRDRPRLRYNPIWPEGTRQPFTQELADYFFDLVSTSDTSVLQLLRNHPELPPYNSSTIGVVINLGSLKASNKHARTKLTS